MVLMVKSVENNKSNLFFVTDRDKYYEYLAAAWFKYLHMVLLKLVWYVTFGNVGKKWLK